MSLVLGIPVIRIGCGVLIDRVRAWSVIDEVILLMLSQEAQSMRALAELTDQPHQVILASIARLMQFRLVELRPTASGAAFGVSAFGQASLVGGHPLPTFPTRSPRRFSFVVECATGDFFPTGPLQLMSLNDLKRLPEARILRVEGGPPMSQADNLARLTQIAARGWDEQVAGVDSRTATVNTKQYLVVRVVDGELQGLPETASERLQELLLDMARRPASPHEIVVPYGGPPPPPLEAVRTYSCDFKPEDLIIGGDAHRDLLLAALAEAHGRLIIHSTFLDQLRFRALFDGFRNACIRGVRIDLIWGDEDEEDPETEAKTKTAVAASEIMGLIDAEPEMRGRFKVHMRSTESHAKLLLWDTEADGWIAVLGSCNWIRSSFQSVELSVILRDQRVVADVCEVLQHMTGRRGLIDALANELGITARDLRREPGQDGGATTLSVVVGTGHEVLMRQASLDPVRRLLIGAHKLGANARPGAILPAEAAAARKVESTILYSVPAGPVRKRHAKALEIETAENGVRLVKVDKPALHGKFVAWDDDNVVVTSLNWTSGAADPEHPWNDLGIHLRAPGLAALLIARLAIFFPKGLGSGDRP